MFANTYKTASVTLSSVRLQLLLAVKQLGVDANACIVICLGVAILLVTGF